MQYAHAGSPRQCRTCDDLARNRLFRTKAEPAVASEGSVLNHVFVAFEWQQVEHGGRPIYVRVGSPEGRPPVVLVHGLLISGDYLMPTAMFLARRYRVYVPDLPASGRSPGPDDELDVSGLANALIAVLDGLGIRDAHLVA